jgi:putative transposase
MVFPSRWPAGCCVSPNVFYLWKAAPVTERDWSDVHLINAAVDVHRDDRAFGYPFIADELEHQGFSAGENRVARLCSSQQTLVCVPRSAV